MVIKILTTPLRNDQPVVSSVSSMRNTRIMAMPRATTTQASLNGLVSPPCSCPYGMYQNLHACHSDMDPVVALGPRSFTDQEQSVLLFQTFPVAFSLSNSKETWDWGLTPHRLGSSRKGAHAVPARCSAHQTAGCPVMTSTVLRQLPRISS